MKTRFMGLAIVLVALAVLVNVLAISSATVNSNLTVNVVNTSSAMIALAAPVAPATLDNDVVVDTSSGVMAVTLDDGLQPGSTYTFKSVFSITNNSDDAVDVTLSTTGTPAGMTVTFRNVANDAVVSSTAIASAGNLNVYMVIANTSSTAIASHAITVVLSATNPTNP